MQQRHAAINRLHTLKANGRPLNTVVSSPCFEFWLLLHFGYTDKPYACKDKKSVGQVVVSDLKKQPGFEKYDKGITGVFKLLGPSWNKHSSMHSSWQHAQPSI